MSDALWSALHEALDARRDPLRDARVEALLAQQPESLPPLLDLLERLQTLPPATAPPARPVRPRRVAAAAGLALALGLAWTIGASWPAGDAPAIVPPAGQVLSWRVTITHDLPAGTSRTLCEDGRVTLEGSTVLEGPDSIARITTHLDLKP